MKIAKFTFFFIIMMMAVLACGMTDDLSTPTPVNLPLEALTAAPSVIPRQPRTPIPTLMVSSPTLAVFTFPAWVVDFSDPILAALDGQRPAFEDDFPAICIDEYKEWKVCSTPEQRTYFQSGGLTWDGEPSISNLALSTARPTLDLQPDLQNGYYLLNKGWFYIAPDSKKNPFYAHIDNGVLVMNLPEGKENKDFWVYNPHFLQRNFVIEFDLEFGASQPTDTFRFQFEQGGNESFAFDLAKNKTWAFHWGAQDDWQSRAGAHEDLSFTPVRVLIIARDSHCAVYLNDAPLDYFENCRTGANAKPSPKAMTFHLLAEPGYSAVVTLDNFKVWDLDKIPSLLP